MRSQPHWAAEFIGLPWDPAKQHCWAFCRAVWAARFGLQVPEMPVDARDLRATMHSIERSDERTRWCRVTERAEGDAVVMARARHDCHVGIWLDQGGGGVLHSIRPASIFTARARLADLGYRITGCYRREG